MEYKPLKIKLLEHAGIVPSQKAMRLPKKGTIKTNLELSQQLIKAGSSPAKFSRGIVYWIEYDMQVDFMLELDTYRIGREVLSTSSTMHNELKDLEGSELADQKQLGLVDKVYTQIAMYSFQCLLKIYNERQHHRLADWQIFCDFIEELPNFKELSMFDR
jgi:hypothetical protein